MPERSQSPMATSCRAASKVTAGRPARTHTQPDCRSEPDVAGSVVVRRVQVHLGFRGLGEATVAPADLLLHPEHPILPPELDQPARSDPIRIEASPDVLTDTLYHASGDPVRRMLSSSIPADNALVQECKWLFNS